MEIIGQGFQEYSLNRDRELGNIFAHLLLFLPQPGCEWGGWNSNCHLESCNDLEDGIQALRMVGKKIEGICLPEDEVSCQPPQIIYLLISIS